jgi:hypothetical protein
MSIVRLAVCLVLSIGALFAQASAARVTARVIDPGGAAIPQAEVKIANVATGVETTGASSMNGLYVFPSLTPGPYELRVEASGFKRYTRSNLVLETGQVLTLDVVLELGAVSETVNVTAETPLLQADTSDISTLVENKTIQNMPLASRRIGSLMRLMGNVTFVSEASWEGISNFAIAGGRGRQQIWQLDGGNLQGVMLVTGIVSVAPPVEAMEEFRVLANGYPAEFGRTMGGFISMTTKSGTNRFKGSLYEFLRNDAFDARNFFATTKAPIRYNVFGGTLGGPIIRDRTHFFFSYEGTRRRDGVTRILNVPTTNEIQGDFSGSSTNVIDPTTGQPFPENRIPGSRLDPVGAALAQLYPAPNVPGARSGNRNFNQNAVNKTTGDSYILKVDHVISPRDRIFGRYLKFRSPVEAGRVYPNPAADTVGDQLSDQFHVTVNWMRNVSPTTFNELRYNYNRRTNEDPSLYPSTIAGDIGLRGVAQDGTPNVNVVGFSSIGQGNQFRLAGPGFQHQVIEGFTWIRGNHQLKAGGEWRSSEMPDLWGSTRAGGLGFNDVATGRGFGLAALLLGWTNTANVDTGFTSARMNYFAGYIQDDWKATSRLTLNFGLRWEMDTPRSEKNNIQTGFDPFAINPVSGTPGSITYAGRDGVSVYAHSFDRNNFGPRFGFAYRPFGDRLVLRGGYGLMYGPIYDDSITRANVVGFGDTRQFQSSDNGRTAAFLLRDGVPLPPTDPIGPGYGAVRVGERPTTSPDFYDPELKATYAHQMNFSIQQQFLGSWLLEAAYTGNLAHKVGGPAVNINEIRPELRGAVQDQRLRPFPQYANVTRRANNWGNSSYHGLNLKVEKRFSRGLNLLSNYTWSKFLDDVQSRADIAGGGAQSYYARHLDKAPSGNDIRHRWVTSAVYELPVGRGRLLDISNKVVDLFLGGWSVGTIAELRSGLAMGVAEQTNRLNAFSPSQRPHIVGDWRLSPDRPRSELINEWFNTEAFAFAGNGVLGNAARTFMTGPGSINVDASILKDFSITESKVLQFRGEFFNLPNRPNFGLPNRSRGNAAFGTIGSASAGRQIQLGLRLVF